MSKNTSPMALHGPATHFDDDSEKLAQDRSMYGGSGGDGMNGNEGTAKMSSLNPSNPRTTGDGSSWSGH
jgi:hypothetical protein